MAMPRTGVFISYRRDGGEALARNIFDALTKRSYPVFMDVESLRAGPFNEGLYREIESADDFVIILTPGCLKRCAGVNDWLRLEIARAFESKKNIVPVMAREFNWQNESELPPGGLPPEIAGLPMLNGVGHSQELFNGTMDRLAGLLKSVPRSYVLKRTLYAAAAAALILAGSAALWQQRQYRSAAVTSEAQKLYAQKDYAGAFYAYCKASDSDLKNVSLHQKVEESARRGRLGAQFLQRYQSLADKYPGEPVYSNYLGNAYLMLDPDDKDGKARAGYETALKLDPNFAPAVNNLAIISYRKGDIAAAETMFVLYLKLSPKDAVGWADLGLLYLYKAESNPKDASTVALSRQAFDKAIALDSGLALAYKGSGRLLALQGQKDKALDAFKRSLALDYDQPEVRRQVELLVWESTREGAVQSTDDMHTRGLHEQAVLNRSLVETMQALDKSSFKQAETLSRELLKKYPDNPLVLRVLGRSLEAQGNTVEAKQAFDAAGRGAAGKEQ